MYSVYDYIDIFYFLCQKQVSAEIKNALSCMWTQSRRGGTVHGMIVASADMVCHASVRWFVYHMRTWHHVMLCQVTSQVFIIISYIQVGVIYWWWVRWLLVEYHMLVWYRYIQWNVQLGACQTWRFTSWSYRSSLLMQSFAVILAWDRLTAFHLLKYKTGDALWAILFHTI